MATNAQTKSLKSKVKSSSVTPMMRQYFEIKSQHEDAILFYRLGDFYEMFNEDAVEASRLLDLTLTTRNKNSEHPIPLCGIPHHAAQGYIGKLVQLGKKVVICEQTEDAKKAKGLVKREVTKVVTPGIVMEDQSLSARVNNFLLCFVYNKPLYHCAVCDVSTGSLEYFTLNSADQLADEIARLQIKEVFYPDAHNGLEELKDFLQVYPSLYHHGVNDLYADAGFAKDLIQDQYQVTALDALGLKAKMPEVQALGLLLGYLKENKILEADLLQQPLGRKSDQFLNIDEASVRNLELFRTLRDDNQQGTLLWHLDHCETSMGSRRLAEFIRTPLMNVSEIEGRLQAVEEILNYKEVSESLKQGLQGVADLERLSNKFVVGSANARDTNGLKDSFLRLPEIQKAVSSCSAPLIQKLGTQIQDFSKLANKIQTTIQEEPGLSIKEGGVIAKGVSPELDELREIESSGKGTIARMESQEKEKTGITSLKIRFNNVFGYYIEVTNTHKDKVPKHYVRKQTLTNAERYITDELKTYESKVLGAEERIKSLEYEIFCQLREEIKGYSVAIKETAVALSYLDVLQSFAVVSEKFDYKKPVVNKGLSLLLKGARHPILERMSVGESFVPNDILLDQKSNTVLIVTGPNMAGKSTIMRMTALITIMGQMGCFVPCDSAEIGLCDRVFTRVGAHDHLQKGMSTFMVEMVETAKILREATAKSLILLDEIGRGTSTFDGLSIAWAVAEDLHDRLRARTLFATHYHELCDLADQKNGVKNFHMSVKEWNGKIIFLRKLKSGGTNRSYGVAVASMAGLPEHTVSRAKEILKLLEIKDMSFQSELVEKSNGQMSLFSEEEHEVVKKIRELEVEQLTPIQALTLLDELKRKVEA